MGSCLLNGAVMVWICIDRGSDVSLAAYPTGGNPIKVTSKTRQIVRVNFLISNSHPQIILAQRMQRCNISRHQTPDQIEQFFRRVSFIYKGICPMIQSHRA